MATKTSRSLILVNECEEGDIQFVTKKDDKFMVTTQDALNACKATENSVRFTHQFQDLVDHLYEWTTERLSQIATAYLTVRQDDVLFLIVQKDVPYNKQLSDDLTALDLEVVNSDLYDLVEMNVLSIPCVSRESAQTFMASGKMVLKYNADKSGSHSDGETKSATD
ncbi:MAG: replication protein [Planctomycetales bacterium]